MNHRDTEDTEKKEDAWIGSAGQGEAWFGRRGKARRGRAWLGRARHGLAGVARHGGAGRGPAWRGEARHGLAGMKKTAGVCRRQTLTPYQEKENGKVKRDNRQ
jgi:hypothetical protein